MAAFTVSMKNFLVKMTLRLFYPLSVVTTMVPTLLRQWRRSLQIERLSQMLLVCYILLHSQSISSITVKKGGYWDTSGVSKNLQKLHSKRSNNWSVTIFINCASEIRIYRVSSGKKLDSVQLATLHFQNQKNEIQSNIFENIFFEASDNQISTRTLKLYAN